MSFDFDSAAALADILARIDAARKRAVAPAPTTQLIAVSKTQPTERVAALIAAGQRHFGENRVQEAQGKFPALKAAQPDLRLHLIGPLQTNKVREAVALFDVIHSLDREKLARALADERSRSGRCPELLIQVNTGEEPQKAGVAPRDAASLIGLVRDELKLPLIGLMCIPPAEDNPAPHFALLAKLARDEGLIALSMGMSGDFETAIAFGASFVRVGTALFGARATA